MGKGMGTRLAFVVVLVLGAAGLGFGQVRGHISGDMVMSLQQAPSVDPNVTTFTTANQPTYWGFETEFVVRHLGFGGVYAVNFEQVASSDWWFDFYSQAVFVSYHLFARRSLFDPYVSAGLGAAGRVALGPAATVPQGSTVLLSIFPVLSGGVGIDLGGLYIGGRVSYLPAMTPPPATSIGGVPLGRVQLTLSAGFAVGRYQRSSISVRFH